MRIHSDVLTEQDLYAALRAARAEHPIGADVRIDTCSRHGSRKRAFAFEVRLLADCRETPADVAADLVAAGRRSQRVRPLPNGGTYGADHGAYGYAPTWCEYGWWIDALYAIDPDAIIGWYKDRADFDGKTRYCFV